MSLHDEPISHSDLAFSLLEKELSSLSDVEGPDDVFEDEMSPLDSQSFHRVDVPPATDYWKNEKSVWESGKYYFLTLFGSIYRTSHLY